MSTATGVKSGLLLTSINSEHTAWLVMHSCYTNMGSVEKFLHMINTLSATQKGAGGGSEIIVQLGVS